MSHRRSWYVYLLLILFPFILFAPIILGGKALFWGTPLTQFIPWWTWAWETTSRGVLPLWNPMLGMGAPLIANYQTAYFYPPTWIYYLLYSMGGVSVMAWGQAIMVVLHLFWAALGTALLIRQLKLGRLAQIIGGVAFGLGGYLISRAGFLSINAAAAWLPWILLGVTKLFESLGETHQLWVDSTRSSRSKKTGRIISSFLLLVLSLAMQLLAGHAQTVWYTFVFASIWALYLVMTAFRKSSQLESPANSDWEGAVEVLDHSPAANLDNQTRRFAVRPAVIGLILFVTAVFMAVCLSAVQLLPTAEYLLQSQRSAAVGYEYALSYSFWPWRLLTFIAPDLYGNPVRGDYWGYANYWEDAVYIGLIPFILAVSVLLTRGKGIKNKKYVTTTLIGFLFVVILVVFLIAMGRNTPIFPWLYKNIPTFDMFQAPTRLTIIAIFCLTLLAAIGVDSWRRPEERGKYWLRLGVMAAAAITIGAGAALFLSKNFEWGIRPSFIRATAILGFWGVGLCVLALKAPEKDDPGILNRNWGLWQWAVVFWVAADLILAGWGLNPGVDLRVYSEDSPNADQVLQLLDGGRLFVTAEAEEQLKFERFLRFDTFKPFNNDEDWTSLRGTLLPNVTILDDIPSANNFDPLIPGRYAIWINLLGEVDPDARTRMLNLMGVEVVESLDSTQEFGIRFDSLGAYPRYHWVPCGLGVESGTEAFEIIQGNSVDFQQEVILEADIPRRTENCNVTAEVEISVKSEFPNKSILTVNSPNPGYLVIADVWYPGWQSFVDGKPAPIHKANYLFKAITIPRGEHEVMLEYQPGWLFIGAVASAVSLFLLLILGLFWIVMAKV